MQKLTAQARLSGVELTEFVKLVLERTAGQTCESIGADDPRFKNAKEYVLKKNAELYKRLA